MTVVSVPEPAVAVPVTDADVLERAADLLDTGEWEWCQGGALIGDGLCVLGAILVASGGRPPGKHIDLPDENAVYRSAKDAFGRVCPHKATWNDAPGRTKQEVVQRLRDAAKQARNQPGK